MSFIKCTELKMFIWFIFLMMLRYPFKRHTSFYPVHTFFLSLFFCVFWGSAISLWDSLSLHTLLSLTHTYSYSISKFSLCIFVICHSSATFVSSFLPHGINSKGKGETEPCRAITEALKNSKSGTVSNQLPCDTYCLWLSHL